MPGALADGGNSTSFGIVATRMMAVDSFSPGKPHQGRWVIGPDGGWEWQWEKLPKETGRIKCHLHDPPIDGYHGTRICAYLCDDGTIKSRLQGDDKDCPQVIYKDTRDDEDVDEDLE